MITIYILKKKVNVGPEDIICKANFVPNLQTELVDGANPGTHFHEHGH